MLSRRPCRQQGGLRSALVPRRSTPRLRLLAQLRDVERRLAELRRLQQERDALLAPPDA